MFFYFSMKARGTLMKERCTSFAEHVGWKYWKVQEQQAHKQYVIAQVPGL